MSSSLHANNCAGLHTLGLMQVRPTCGSADAAGTASKSGVLATGSG